MVIIKIKTDFLDWLAERLNMTEDEAEEFAREFIDTLQATGGLSDTPSPAGEQLDFFGEMSEQEF